MKSKDVDVDKTIFVVGNNRKQIMIIDSMKYLKNYELDVSLINNRSYFAVVRYLNGTSTVFPEYECCCLLPV